MFGFAKKLFGPRANPIGVDFGTDCLRLAQVRFADKEYRLIAAARADVPPHLRDDAEGRDRFFVQTTRDLLAQGRFVGRQAVLAVPAAQMHIQHLRTPKLDEQSLIKMLPFELRGKLPFDPNAALLRHAIAGDIYQDQDPRMELIVMAARRDYVERYLDLAAKAKLQVVGMNVEPRVLVDCFGHIYRRKSDADATSCFVDIGARATRVLIARGAQLLFARSIPIAGDHFAAAVAQGMALDPADARLLRIKLGLLTATVEDRSAIPAPPASPAPPSPPEEQSFALLGAGLARRQRAADAAGEPALTTEASAERWEQPTADPGEQARRVEQSVREPLNRLIEQIDLCRRYHEATFPSRPVDRLIFVGGESRHRTLCQEIARQLGLAAQIGDPLVRMGRVSEVGIESGIDRRQPQPAWAVAIGLSLGPVDGQATEVRP